MSKFRTELTAIWPPTAEASREAVHKPMSPLGLFIELVEIATTRDEPFAEGTRPVPPPSDGWRIADFADEHATSWTRVRLIPSWG